MRYVFFFLLLLAIFFVSAKQVGAKPADRSHYPYSLFYNAQELAFIYAALRSNKFYPDDANDAQIEGDGEGQGIESANEVVRNAALAAQAEALFIAQKATPSSLSSYALNSIIYRNKQDWAVWINGVKYTPQERPKQFSIKQVKENSVILDINVPDIAHWLGQAKHLRALSGGYWTHMNHARNVLARSHSNILRLHLAPNQSFDPEHMSMQDGNISPPVVLHKEIITEEIDDASQDYFDTIAKEAYRAPATNE